MRSAHGPEFKIQIEVKDYLECRGWHVERLIGNAFQSGLPDLLAFHPKWGYRFVEVKYKERYSFTKAQKQKFPVLERFKVGIWILTAGNQEEYNKLFKAPNWRSFVKKTWKIPTQQEIDTAMEEIRND